MSNFFSELQRRNVLRVVAAYALVAWIIIEAGSVLLPTFGATAGTFQIYVIIVVVGFVVSLFAWVFEITPEGLRLDRNAKRTAEQTRKSGRVMNYAIIGLLVIALIVSMTFNVADLQADIPTRNSIAVLPFESRSSDPENALFADGIHDDLLTKLANTGAMKVISRTSVLEYRNTTKKVVQIGEELRVDTLLEGSVQKVGDNVRINVQLIDAKTDEHLWAKIYDRKLTMENIFSIQSEISDAISVALKATLMTGEISQDTAESIPTHDMRAYRLYVSGRDNLYLRRLETLQEARTQFEQAIDLDPEYAEAYVGLAESILLLNINHFALPPGDAYRLAQDNLDIALALDPNLADAYATLGLLKAHVWSRTRMGEENLEAEAAYERAISLNPNHARAYMWFASLRSDEQRFEDSIAFYHRSLQLDPLGRIPSNNLPTLYARLGQNDLALKLWLDVIEVHPEWPTPYQQVSQHLAGLGRLDEALAWNRTAQSLTTELLSGNIDLGIYLQFGDLDKAHELLESLPAGNPVAPFADGLMSLIDGDYNDALDKFTSVIDRDDHVQPFMFDIAMDIALLAGDLPKAREYIYRREPLLDHDTNPTIDRYTVRKAVKLAYIDLQNGDSIRANELLSASLTVVQNLPRMGLLGYGVLDAQIYALMGRKEDAFVALNRAIEEGFRSSIFIDNWLLDIDPFLASISGDPRFTEILERLESLNAVMHQRVIEAEESGDWDSLTSLDIGAI